MRNRLEIAGLKALAAALAWRNRAAFSRLETLCLFVGHPRSGHSLVGALIDAHPDAVIAHELNMVELVKAGVQARQLWALMLWNARRASQNGRQDALSGYDYAVPGQWQGRFRELRVIGDKKGGFTTWYLRQEPRLLERLRVLSADIALRFIHVERNPFDVIASMSRHNGRSLADNTRMFFQRCETLQSLSLEMPGSVLEIRHESLVASPQACLKEICGFLALDAQPDYLQACSGIVYQAPHQSRHALEWPDPLIRGIQERIENFPFLQGYSFDKG